MICIKYYGALLGKAQETFNRQEKGEFFLKLINQY
jgi:hypothetical protein